jgi:hypothetical protein
MLAVFQQAKLGVIRLVNPWRGYIWCADVDINEGVLSARTGAIKLKAFEQWDIYVIHDGLEYSCWRSFTKKELISLLNNNDEYITKNLFDVESFEWSGFTPKKVVLPEQSKPSTMDFQQLAEASLSMNLDVSYPLIDLFELWMCDKETLKPVALVSTGNSLEEIKTQAFSPVIRLGSEDLSFNFRHFESAASLQFSINERVNNPFDQKQPFVTRMFHRAVDGKIFEYCNNEKRYLPQAVDILPPAERFLSSPYWERLRRLS